jgi:hypothetical protein
MELIITVTVAASHPTLFLSIHKPSTNRSDDHSSVIMNKLLCFHQFLLFLAASVKTHQGYLFLQKIICGTKKKLIPVALQIAH